MQEILSITLGMFLALIQFIFICVIGFLFFKMKWLSQEAINGINTLMRKFFFPCVVLANLVRVVRIDNAH